MRRRMLGRTAGLLAEAATGAVDVLVEIANDQDVAPACQGQCRASDPQRPAPAIELHELSERVADLEQRIAATGEKESYAA